MTKKLEILSNYQLLPECLQQHHRALNQTLQTKNKNVLIRHLRSVYRGEILKSAQRAGAFVVSKELAYAGIAPRWQFDDSENDIPLTKLTRCKEEQAQIKEIRTVNKADAIYFDLLWLTVTYPNHITKQDNWQELFKYGDDWNGWFTTASNIANSNLSNPRKVRRLNLSDEQQLGCRILCRSDIRSKAKQIQARIPSVMRRIEKDTHGIRQRSQLDILARAQSWAAGKLTNWSPSKSATVRAMMTGQSISKQSMSEALTKVKNY